jgi:hypothetical protein
MISNIIHVCNLSIDFQIHNMFCCSVLVMVQGVLSGVLVMDDSKSETKDNHGEWAVICYIFCVMYGKIESDVMDN